MQKKSLIILGLLLATALFGLLHLTYNFYLDYDSGIYGVSGRNWAQGKGFTLGGYPMTLFPHGYPFLYRLLYPLTSNLELIGKFWALLTLLGTILLVYLLAREICGEGAARLSAFLIGTHGFILEIWSRLYAENLFIFLLILGLYITHRIIIKPQFVGAQRAVPLLVLLALVGAANTWTKPEGLLFFGLQLLIILIFFKEKFLMRLGAVSLAGIIFLAALFPYLNFLHQHTGRWQLSRKMALNVRVEKREGREDWLTYERNNFALNPDKKTILGYQGPDPPSWRAELGDWPVIKRKLSYNSREAAKTFWRQWELWILLSLGALALGWRKMAKPSPGYYLLLVSLLPLASLLFFHIEKRLLLPYMMIIAIFMAQGVVYLYQLFRDKFSAWRWLALFLLIISIVFSIYDTNKNTFKRALRPEIQSSMIFDKNLGLWMKNNLEGADKEIIVAMYPVYSFYSGADFLHLPYTENIDDLFLFMKNNQARYLVLLAPQLRDRRPLFLSLMTPQKAPDFLETIKAAGGEEGVIIYRLKSG